MNTDRSAITADTTPIAAATRKNNNVSVFSIKSNRSSVNIILFRSISQDIKYKYMSWFNFKPRLKNPPRDQSSKNFSPTTERMMKEVKEKVRPLKEKK